MDQERLISVMESILFAAENPVSLERFTETFAEQSPSKEEFVELIAKIKEKYLAPTFGFELREALGGFHFVTKADNAEWVRRFLAMKPFRLGRSSLEVLSIIAYRQPITRSEIDRVRGIDSSHLLRTLMERGIVKMVGKAEVPGRPVQYGTTTKFLELVGLNTLSDLPPLSELQELQGDTKEPEESLEDSLERVMTSDIDLNETLESDDHDEQLENIDQMIQSVRKPSDEVHASPLHKDIADQNQAALDGFLSYQKPMRRRKNQPAIEPSVGVEMQQPGAEHSLPPDTLLN